MLVRICLFLLVLFPLEAASACPQYHQYETVNVKKVIDGDTVHLEDGRRIRFVGINSPELYKNGRFAPEPGAVAARRWLRNKLPDESQMKLVFARKRRDDYGRLLAHPLTNDGRLLVAGMLAAGLGELMLIPPNHGHWRCLLQAEQRARRRQLGIWSHGVPNVPVQPGWQPLLIRVHEVRAHRGRVTLLGAGGLELRAGRQLPAESRRALGRLRTGEHLFVRGRVHRTDAGWLLWLNHPWQFYREK
ncbi:thermonuclease family protein [Oceanimonas pelagia]|uniref:Thermonuclease family protein n=1 Tax=Oceanimonas pelagia TaxID=3028314 RepID=A0AA50KSD4_9GAMM|nr:thermonuclease family protein [Oceanimonas pelagia]WMC12471.1 thermonuclease family protein [Oceanimonas pelagia]